MKKMHKKRGGLAHLVGPLACATVAVGCSQQAEKPMNIVFIMTDDHSYQTISAYGESYNSTPNIDRIGKEGVVFTNSFVANSISGPSRACILTGKHSHKNGYMNNIDCTFDGSQQTFPKLLQQAGYETAIVGKWHLISEPTGFDYWNILIGQGEYYNPTFINNGDTTRLEGYATTLTTDIALDWLEKRNGEKPFCLMLHHKAPHRTWMPELCDLGAFDSIELELPHNFFDTYEGRIAAQEQEMSIVKDMDLVYDLKMADEENEIHSSHLEHWGRNLYQHSLTPEQKAAWDAYYNPIIEDFKRKNYTGEELARWKYERYMRDYLSVIRSVDRNVGRVLDYLEQHNLLENTLVVYVSDQGFYMGEHGWFDKRFMYEESFRTPLLMRLPGGVKGRVEQMVQNIDYAPTFLQLAGVEVPSDIQGESLLPLLKGDTAAWNRDALYYHFYEYPAEHAVKRHYGIRTERYKLMHFYNDIDTWELYDLQNDKAEMHNIYQDGLPIVDSLKSELEQLQRLYDDPIALKNN